MITVIETLKSEEVSAQSAFILLAGNVAKGMDVDAAKAKSILAAAGKSVADLEANVAYLRRVAELKAQIAAVPDDLHVQVAKLNAAELDRIKALEAETLRRRREDAEKHGEYIQAERRLRMLGERKAALLKELDTLLAEVPELHGRID